jgi:hypothetical protein
MCSTPGGTNTNVPVTEEPGLRPKSPLIVLVEPAKVMVELARTAKLAVVPRTIWPPTPVPVTRSRTMIKGQASIEKR